MEVETLYEVRRIKRNGTAGHPLQVFAGQDLAASFAAERTNSLGGQYAVYRCRRDMVSVHGEAEQAAKAASDG